MARQLFSWSPLLMLRWLSKTILALTSHVLRCFLLLLHFVGAQSALHVCALLAGPTIVMSYDF